jgi:hypothetical protein
MISRLFEQDRSTECPWLTRGSVYSESIFSNGGLAGIVWREREKCAVNFLQTENRARNAKSASPSLVQIQIRPSANLTAEPFVIMRKVCARSAAHRQNGIAGSNFLGNFGRICKNQKDIKARSILRW